MINEYYDCYAYLYISSVLCIERHESQEVGVLACDSMATSNIAPEFSDDTSRLKWDCRELIIFFHPSVVSSLSFSLAY